MDDPLTVLSLEQLRRRRSIKWTRYPPDVLPLWVAEMDVPVAPPVVAAVCDAMRAGDTGYAGEGLYAEALAGFARRRWGWSFTQQQTVPVADVMTGVTEVLKVLTGPGEAVVVNSPVYTPFYEFIEAAGRVVLEAPLGEDHRIDLDVLEATFRRAVAGAARAAYLLCSPHNPTGTVHTREELDEVLAVAERYGVRVVADEIHAPLAFDEHLPLLSLPGAERAVSVTSASKAWNLAGLKAAAVVAGADAVADLARMPAVVGHGPSHLGVLAHCAALEEGEEWLAALLANLDANRALLDELLAEHLPAIGYRPPQGTYLAWLDCRALGLPGEPGQFFLERARVALVPGESFGTGGEGHVRLNLATSATVLTEAVRRMAAAVERERR